MTQTAPTRRLILRMISPSGGSAGGVFFSAVRSSSSDNIGCVPASRNAHPVLFGHVDASMFRHRHRHRHRHRACEARHSHRRHEFASSRHNAKEEKKIETTDDGIDDFNNNNNDDDDDMTPEEMAVQQARLHREASSLTRTLYRKCLRSIDLIAGGNDRDERDFAEREAEERGDQFADDDDSKLDRRMRVSMTPPVNREEELRSRAEYYRAFARENFDGHDSLLSAHGFLTGDEGNTANGLGWATDGVGGSGGGRRGWNQYQGGHHHLGMQMSAQYQGGGGVGVGGGGGGRNKNGSVDGTSAAAGGDGHYMWREEQIDQFVYLIRSGEEKRRWIMNDYEFEDAHDVATTADDDDYGKTSSRGWSHELERRLRAFEVRSKSLVREMYRREGWMHSTDRGEQRDDDDGFFSDSDSEEEHVPKHRTGRRREE